jgi:hypothetical protein
LLKPVQVNGAAVHRYCLFVFDRFGSRVEDQRAFHATDDDTAVKLSAGWRGARRGTAVARRLAGRSVGTWRALAEPALNRQNAAACPCSLAQIRYRRPRVRLAGRSRPRQLVRSAS